MEKIEKSFLIDLWAQINSQRIDVTLDAEEGDPVYSDEFEPVLIFLEEVIVGLLDHGADYENIIKSAYCGKCGCTELLCGHNRRE